MQIVVNFSRAHFFTFFSFSFFFLSLVGLQLCKLRRRSAVRSLVDYETSDKTLFFSWCNELGVACIISVINATGKDIFVLRYFNTRQ